MHVLCSVASLLTDVRAHIPNQPSFGSGGPHSSYGTPVVRALAAFVITVVFLLAVLWLAVRFAMGFL
jgi:hypothetical protein